MLQGVFLLGEFIGTDDQRVGYLQIVHRGELAAQLGLFRIQFNPDATLAQPRSQPDNGC